MAAGQQFWAVAGPMHNDQVINNILLLFIADYGLNKVIYYYYYDQVPPFSWANTNLTDSPHYTPIITFDFQPEVKTWGLKGINQVIY